MDVNAINKILNSGCLAILSLLFGLVLVGQSFAQNWEEMILKWTAYPCVGQVWQRNWERITPFFHSPADIRKAIYTAIDKILVDVTLPGIRIRTQ
jgi:hypothetical protein